MFSYSTKVIVKNLKKNKDIFFGRVIKNKDSMDEDGTVYKTIECEDRLGYLHDTLMDYLPEQHWNVSSNTYKSDNSIEKSKKLKKEV